MPFTKLNLNNTILAALKKLGYKQPTPIQEQAIPRILAGKDIIATAQTGTGKTAAFLLPALQLLLSQPKQKLPQILILAPVRELAQQIMEAIHKYSGEAKITAISILGGMPYGAQLRQLSKPADVIVATPGRLIDYLKRGSVNLSQIKMLVLDEADRMLDMGFINDVKLITQHVPDKRQTLLFTATMDERVKKLAQGILHKPEHISIVSSSVTLTSIKQSVYLTDDAKHKHAILNHLLTAQNIYKVIIFAATKHYTDTLSQQLHAHGHTVDALHGDIKQQKRNRILEQFRKGKINILVATDVAARGIDISDISHVINYDIPKTPEDYVHRIGRTGRAKRTGIAISFILPKETSQLKRIERFINETIEQAVIAGLEPKQSASVSKPKRQQKPGGRNHKSNVRKQKDNRYKEDSKPKKHRKNSKKNFTNKQ